MKIIVTGAAGFIGYHLSQRLLKEGKSVIGIDNLNNYYDLSLKHARLEELYKSSSKYKSEFIFFKKDLEDFTSLNNIFKEHKPLKVVNLAAQAGVRFSIKNPRIYINSNLVGFGNILELCKDYSIEHLIYASSSSVYGGNTNYPFSEKDGVNHPVSIYAATKKANELMAHSYSHLFSLPTTGLRFFTVYGPWGRPDMALFLFTKSMIAGEKINVFNKGNMFRDFTFIDDITESLIKILNKPPTKNSSFNKNNPDPSSSWSPYKIFNIGNSQPRSLMDYINTIEDCLNIKAKINYLPMQMGDVPYTSADTSKLEKWINYKPETSIKDGIDKFITWYKNFYQT
tara:strand:- start:10848 stop:11870 length:1023 start_codon:yes stop_codon:yes gene_type:complete